MTIWVHRPFPSEDELGLEHADDNGACWCNPMRLDNSHEALTLARTLAEVAIALFEHENHDS